MGITMLKSINLNKTYQVDQNVTNAIVDCNIEIEEGECVAIVGTKGSGKTTLLRLLGGFERPTNGTVFINQKDINSFSEDDLAIIRREKIGYLFQNDSLIPELTVHENIIMPTLLTRRKYEEDFYQSLTERLHISDILSRYPKQLSATQLHCIAYARALINQPNIILIDEPADHVNAQISKEILDFLLDMVYLYHKTLIMVTKEPEISIFADHIIKLKDGIVIEDKKNF